eukprot:353420-Chlamydomonas_euryale.AAC.2
MSTGGSMKQQAVRPSQPMCQTECSVFVRRRRRSCPRKPAGTPVSRLCGAPCTMKASCPGSPLSTPTCLAAGGAARPSRTDSVWASMRCVPSFRRQSGRRRGAASCWPGGSTIRCWPRKWRWQQRRAPHGVLPAWSGGGQTRGRSRWLPQR